MDTQVGNGSAEVEPKTPCSVLSFCSTLLRNPEGDACEAVPARRHTPCRPPKVRPPSQSLSRAHPSRKQWSWCWGTFLSPCGPSFSSLSSRSRTRTASCAQPAWLQANFRCHTSGLGSQEAAGYGQSASSRVHLRGAIASLTRAPDGLRKQKPLERNPPVLES